MLLGQLTASHVVARCHFRQGCWRANEGNSRPGGATSVSSLLGSSFLPLPFLRLCFPFVSFFFNLSFPLNDEKKSDSHRTQTLAKGEKAQIICLVLFHLYFRLFVFIL